MDQIFQFCNARHFKDEKTGNGFTRCCHKGKIKIEKFNEIPDDIKLLFIGNDQMAKNFREYIRNYNIAVSFATMKANIDPLMHRPGNYFF